MKMLKIKHLKKCLAVFLMLILLSGNLSVYSYAETLTLTPDDLKYENGNVVLHKQAERIGSDTWKVNVNAKINEVPVEPPKMEVAFVLDVSGSMNSCAEEYSHINNFNHIHTLNYNLQFDYIPSCKLICENSSHTHVDACYDCGLPYQEHAENNSCKYKNDEGEIVKYESRFSIAKQVIAYMEDSLPEGTSIAKVGFNIKNFPFYTKDNYEYETAGYKIFPTGDTYMMDGVRLALDKSNPNCCFTDDESIKKVLIIVTDGAATDKNYGKDDDLFNAFKEEGGIVYTVGFNHVDENLSSMIANGGTYSRASDPDELFKAFENITTEITAMLVDPMGSTVDFEVGTEKPAVSSIEGEITYDKNATTIFWNPSSVDSVANSSIGYEYTVTLNENAPMSAGIHKNVPLNGPTYLYYGMESDMKRAAFPIPHATYAVSTMQVNWKHENQDIQDPTDKESVICDFGDVDFETDYKTITPVIEHEGTTYYYQKTIITKDGNVVKDVSVSDASEYVVTHLYSLEKEYNVIYEYTGTVPAGAPDAAANNIQVKAGEQVQIADDPSIDDYIFSGWTIAEGNVTENDGSFTMPENDVKLQGSWEKVKKAQAVVHFVDENGTALKADVSSDEIAVGDPYNVSATENILEIVVDGQTYVFDNDDNAVYSGTMPESGVEITRVYKLKEVIFYYQINSVYKGYDADGNEIYSKIVTGTVESVSDPEKVVTIPESCQYDGYDFTRKGADKLSADLTGTTEDNPYVFVIEYEFQKTTGSSGDSPDTSDDGPGLWIGLFAASSFALIVLQQIGKRRVR